MGIKFATDQGGESLEGSGDVTFDAELDGTGEVPYTGDGSIVATASLASSGGIT